MAGLYSPIKLSPSSLSLLLLSLLPLSLAAFAFILHWKYEFGDPTFNRPNSLNHLEYMHTTTSFNCVDTLGQSGSISFPYFRDFRFNYKSDLKPKICITTSTSAGLEQILPWIYYHKVIGVTNFFLFVEAKAATPDVSKVLESVPKVKLVRRTKELEEEQAKSPMWNETYMSNYFYKPCNHELYIKQYLNMEMAIVMAREAHMDWILHLDTDELIYPAGTPEYTLRQLLSDVPENVDMVVFPNYESCVERDVQEPFTEVSMFKKNFDHLMEETYFRNYRESVHGNPNYFLTYANGKSAARVQQHLRPSGAHRWHNYMKTPNVGEFSEAAVLHYTYAKFSDLTSRRDRCGCKPTEKEVEKCFFLEFDRAAFIIASSATEEEMLNWYRKHVVWSDKDLKKKLMKEGILTRIYDPMLSVKYDPFRYKFVEIATSAPHLPHSYQPSGGLVVPKIVLEPIGHKFKVIMQGLKETVVYSSLIITVQTSRSEDMFLSSNEVISNSPKFVDELSSARIGKKEYQMTVSDVLQQTETDLLAMPPLPSPVMDGIDHHRI